MVASLSNIETVKHYQLNHKKRAAVVLKKYPNLSLLRVTNTYFDKLGEVLDYGCGGGCNSVYLLEKGHNVTAADTSEDATNKVKNRVKELRLKGSILKTQVIAPEALVLPFEDESFDYIVCASVLSLLGCEKNIHALLGEFKRIIKKKGKLFLDINGPNSEFAVFGDKLEENTYKFSGKKGNDNSFIAFCPKNESIFKAIVEQHFAVDDIGFTAHKFFDYAEHEYIISAQKNS